MPISDDQSSARTPPNLIQRLGADRVLQAEIDKAMAGLADGLPSIQGLRLSRVLSTVLEPSWAEHRSFQDEALFPILTKANCAQPQVHPMLARLSREHDEIDAHQGELLSFLNAHINGQRAVTAKLTVCLTEVLSLRRRHHEVEAALESLIPAALDAADRAALDHWAASRPAPPFPINLAREFWD
jgi:hypothetical protein